MDAFAILYPDLKEILTTVGNEIRFDVRGFFDREFNSLIASLPSKTVIYVVIQLFRRSDGVLVKDASYFSNIDSAEDLRNAVRLADCMRRDLNLVTLYAL